MPVVNDVQHLTATEMAQYAIDFVDGTSLCDADKTALGDGDQSADNGDQPIRSTARRHETATGPQTAWGMRA